MPDGYEPRPVTELDHEWVLGVVEDWDVSNRWSLGGRSPSPQLIAALLGRGVAFQVALWGPGGPAGVVQVCDVNPDSGYGSLGLLIEPGAPAAISRVLISSVAEAMDQLSLRKLWLGIERDALDIEARLGPAARCVGRFADHVRRAQDDYADLVIYEVWREELAG
jgi:hypothetical protein